MLSDLIPPEAVVQGLELNPDALALRDELAVRVATAVPGLRPMEASAFVQRLLIMFCQGGTPIGLALCPPAIHPRPHPSQKRLVPPSAWQRRTPIAEPLLCALARRIAHLTAEDEPTLAAELPRALEALDQISRVLNELAETGRWNAILRTRPAGPANRLFDLHFHTAGYPAWEHLALRLHIGLVAQIRKEAANPPGKRDHNICAYCTAPKAIVPLLSAHPLVSALAVLDEEEGETALQDLLQPVVRRIQNLERVTRRDYVTRFVDLVRCGAAAREIGARESAQRPSRRRTLPFTLAELEPEAAPAGIPDADRWQKLARQSAHDEDAPSLEPDLTADDGDEEPTAAEEPQVEATAESTRSGQPHRECPFYLGNRLTLDRNPGPDRPGVFQIPELAELYRAVRPSAQSDPAAHLHEATRFLVTDLLIHTGRPPDWLARLTLGRRPAPEEPLDQPVYDPARGAICYPPDCAIGIPPRLVGHGEDAHNARRFQAESCEPVRLWYDLPLAPRQVGFLAIYRERRAQVLPAGSPLAADSGPLLLAAESGRLRPWTAADTVALCRRLTETLQHRHPGWPAVRPARFRLTFTAWYGRYGLDPVYALAISGHYRQELQMPVIYSRVRIAALARAYAAAQDELRAAVEAEYRRLAGAPVPGQRDPALWRPKLPLQTEPWAETDSFGSWHCPYPAHVRALFAGLGRMAAATDPAAAQRGRVARLAVGLTALAGLRPTEVCHLRDRWVDLADGTMAVDGKDNFALTADRQVPIPTALRPALVEALAESAAGPWTTDGRGHYLLWLPRRGVPAALHEGVVDDILLQAGQRAGLREDQVPDWYALRHYWRSQALAAGLPFAAINALMGHQVQGCDLYNRALDQRLDSTLANGQAQADQIAREIGVIDDPS